MSPRQVAPPEDLEYDIDGYGEMMTDRIRMDAYANALRAAVRPGAVVLDIGTGTGIFALLACQLGARRVFAVEPSPMIQVAREIAASNGFAGRIEFRQALSTEIELPELADVIVSDFRGVMPFHGNHLPAIIDARRRLLAPGGIMIPRCDSLWLAVVDAPELHLRVREPWADNRFGLDMRAGAKLAANTWNRGVVRAEQLLTDPCCCDTLDYASRESPEFAAEVTAHVVRAGSAHGFCIWFDTLLTDGIGFSNAPGKPELIYGMAYFRWPDEVALDADDTVTITVNAAFIAGRYEWTWNALVLNQGDTARVKAKTRQATFLGRPMTLDSLKRKAEDYEPRLGESGEIDRTILQEMATRTPLGEIARILAARFPARFPGWRDALARVGDLCSRYSQ